MTDKKFIVRMTQYWEYEVTADDADDAVLVIQDERLPKGDCGGYSIEAVVSPDKAGKTWNDEDDERAKCLACGHLFYDGHTGARHYDYKTRQSGHPTACNEYGCECLNGVAPVAEQAEAVAR